MIAISALHMSNATQQPSGFSRSAVTYSQSQQDALIAKQTALCLLNSALGDIDSVDIDVALAVVLLFIEAELIDSGKAHWKHHVKGARAIIARLLASKPWKETPTSSLRSSLISECLVFDIIGSTLGSPSGIEHNYIVSSGKSLSLLQDAEGNHCSSFPAKLLQLVQKGAQLLPREYARVPPIERAFHLLHTAQSFDPLEWATALQLRSPAADSELRTHVAGAHRAAVCISLGRVLLLLSPTSNLPLGLEFETLVAGIINDLSFIQLDHALYPATTWPAFVAGAQTTDNTTREFVANRFRALWTIQPWSNIKAALAVLHDIWAQRKRESEKDGIKGWTPGQYGNENWIGQLRG